MTLQNPMFNRKYIFTCKVDFPASHASLRWGKFSLYVVGSHDHFPYEKWSGCKGLQFFRKGEFVVEPVNHSVVTHELGYHRFYYLCHGQKSLYWGMVIPPLIGILIMGI